MKTEAIFWLMSLWGVVESDIRLPDMGRKFYERINANFSNSGSFDKETLQGSDRRFLFPGSVGTGMVYPPLGTGMVYPPVIRNRDYMNRLRPHTKPEIPVCTPPARICPLGVDPFCAWSILHTPMWSCDTIVHKIMNGRRNNAPKHNQQKQSREKLNSLETASVISQ